MVAGVDALVWQLLDGQAPFCDPNDATIMPLVGRILTQPPRVMNRADVPASLVAVLERGLSKDRNDRFGSVEAFGAALRVLRPGAGPGRASGSAR